MTAPAAHTARHAGRRGWVWATARAGVYPPLVRSALADEGDERMPNELMGFTTRLAAKMAQTPDDPWVGLEVVRNIGGARWRVLLAVALEAGILKSRGDGDDAEWSLIQSQDFLITARPGRHLEGVSARALAQGQ